MTDPNTRVFEALGLLQQARLLIQAEFDDCPNSWALSDAECLTYDAISQLRGELQARLPERPIIDRGAA